MKRLSLRRAQAGSRWSVLVDIDTNKVVFRGSKADCAAWLKLNEYDYDRNAGYYFK
jgi:hypothetical protein